MLQLDVPLTLLIIIIIIIAIINFIITSSSIKSMRKVVNPKTERSEESIMGFTFRIYLCRIMLVMIS